MGYICAQNNRDSLALIFYEFACKVHEENANEWYYAQNLLNIASCYVDLRLLSKADSILCIAKELPLEDMYIARYYEKRGLFFEAQQQYDSALVCFKHALTYRECDKDKSYDYLKMMQAYYDIGDIPQSLFCAHYVVKYSTNPNYLINAYYCLMQDAKEQNNAELLSYYSHARTDAQNLLRKNMLKDAEALPLLEEYLKDPHPLRWVWIMLATILLVCIILFVGAVVYRQRNHIASEQIDRLSVHVENQDALLSQELYYRQFREKLSNIVDKYHAPHKRWKEYKTLKRDLSPWLHIWMCKLDTLPLSEREKIFCTIRLVYSYMSDIEIAEYLCYDKHGIRVFKQRIAKKIGTTSADLLDFLRNLPVNE